MSESTKVTAVSETTRFERPPYEAVFEKQCHEGGCPLPITDTICSTHCTVHDVQHTAYSIRTRYTVANVQYMIYFTFSIMYNTQHTIHILQYTVHSIHLRLRTENYLGVLHVMRQVQFTAEHENRLVLKVRWRLFGIHFGINLEFFWMPSGNPSTPGEAKRPQDVAQELLSPFLFRRE